MMGGAPRAFGGQTHMFWNVAREERVESFKTVARA